jgi:hypothetical protein
MKLYRHNGEHWYVDNRSLLKRFRCWLIWIGGWEKANHSGWQFRRQQIGYVPPRYRWLGVTPVSLFGHRITVQRFGVSIRFRRGYLCFNHDARHHYGYFSPNATPWAATMWLYGAPHDVQHAGDTWEREFHERQAEYARKDQEMQREAERIVAARDN